MWSTEEEGSVLHGEGRNEICMAAEVGWGVDCADRPGRGIWNGERCRCGFACFAHVWELHAGQGQVVQGTPGAVGWEDRQSDVGGPSLPCFWQGYMGPHSGVMMVTMEGDSKCKKTSSYRAGRRVEFEGFGKQQSGIWKMRLPIIGCCICWMRKTLEAMV